MEPLETLSDVELIDRESCDRAEFLQLDRVDPRALGTTYRVIRASGAHLSAWRRWAESGKAARLRGLTLLRRLRPAR